MRFDETELAVIRRAYAGQMLVLSGVVNERLEAAFAAVPREAFAGPPPWSSARHAGRYRQLVSDDPSVLYQDILIALAPERGVNNGSPSLHALWLDAAALRPGERVAHIGCGAGYYSALIAELVGPAGHVQAVEFDPDLAEKARAHLRDRSNVEVVIGDGAAWPQGPVDCIYVNFSVERPALTWLDSLAPGGRLVFPLGVPGETRTQSGGRHAAHGVGLRIERQTGGFSARSLGNAFFVCAEGELVAGAADSAALRTALKSGGADFVRSLRWRQPPLPDRSWFIGDGWSLGYDEPG